MLQKVRKINFFLVLIVVMFFSSCGESGVIVNQSFPVKDAKWTSTDSLFYEFEIQDTLNYYDFSVLVRNTENYQWSNIYLFSDLTFPNGKTRRDTIELLLADKYGNWIGNNSGTVVTTSAVFMNHRKFPLSGDYKIAITHGMRDPVLEEVSDVGIKIKQWAKN